MRLRVSGAALVLACGAILAAQGQGPPGARVVVVAGDDSSALTAWKAGGSGFEQVWRSAPRAADLSRRAEVFATAPATSVSVADVDADGSNDLVVVDPLGITVYGRTPAYHALPALHEGGLIVLLDADGNGALDFVTLRTRDRVSTIEAFARAPEGLVSLWSRTMPGPVTTALAAGDVDGDGQPELLCASDTVTILRRKGAAWEVAATVPTANTSVRALVVADVDRDGRNEILVGGTSGRAAMLKFRKSGEGGTYPVVWQSALLAAPELSGLRPGVPPSAPVVGIEAADTTGDKHAEIVVSTSESGRLGEKDVYSSWRTLVFEFDGRGDFVQRWASPHSPAAAGGKAVAGDLDGDGVAEIVVGREVYRRAAGGGYQAAGPICASCTAGVIGNLPELRDPSAVRVVPAYWSVAGQAIPQGEAMDVTLTLLSPWAAAKDVTVTVRSANARLTVANGVLRVPVVPAGGAVATPAFGLTANGGADPARLDVEVAAGGVRQTFSKALYVTAPLPVYDASNLDARIARALVEARDDNRRVLVQWGVKGDAASKALIQEAAKGDLARTLLYEFVVVRADATGNGAIASRYKAAASLPFLTVLDAQGKVLGGQAASAFRKAGEPVAYDGRKLNDYLLTFKPVPVNAEPLFTAALSQAKKDQKALFLWFSAPW